MGTHSIARRRAWAPPQLACRRRGARWRVVSRISAALVDDAVIIRVESLTASSVEGGADAPRSRARLEHPGVAELGAPVVRVGLMAARSGLAAEDGIVLLIQAHVAD